jgi:asparagine synthase (glutamine-hydrolysing)
MCGIAGFLEPHGSSAEQLAALAKKMVVVMAHRGPDDEGVWVDADAGLAFGHRRLSIIDLSASGHQPMVSPSGRYVLTYNGEIYNYVELRNELIRAGERFAGSSDTEVLLRAIERWGLIASLHRANGMFALALWDTRERCLQLARDRLGEKPLYYGLHHGRWLFASELKALRAHPDFMPSTDRDVVAAFMRDSFVPGTRSIYAGISKVPPGSVVELPWGTRVPPVPVPFWSLYDVAASTQDRLSDEKGALDELDYLLRDAVKLRMQADVPLGASLSGGIDSSLVVALMQEQNSRPVRTFTIGMASAQYDESKDAACVAAALGTDHSELIISSSDALKLIPELPRIWDEPFGDSSQLPTLLISRLARSSVTVSLCGDGGDETFGGYNRYTWACDLWAAMRHIPRPLRVLAARGVNAVAPHSWERLLTKVEPVLPRRLRVRTPGTKLRKMGEILPARNEQEMYELLVAHWHAPEQLVLGSSALPRVDGNGRTDLHHIEQMMFIDTISALPEDMLVKVDRASMAVGLEARVPLLDHRVVEFAWALPFSMKIHNGKGKWPLRQLLRRRLPAALFDRPKAGFSVPIDEWLRGPLRPWAEELLDGRRLRAEGYLAPELVRQKWDEHLSGRRDWQYQLWNVLMFQAWLEDSKTAGLTRSSPISSVGRPQRRS